MEEQSSNSSADSVVYKSSNSDEEQSARWDSDWSIDSEVMIRRIQSELTSSPVLIAVRIMTTGSLEEEKTAGPSAALPDGTPTGPLTLKL